MSYASAQDGIMPLSPEYRFMRQTVHFQERIGLVVPQDAKPLHEVVRTLALPTPSDPPSRFAFHYEKCPVASSQLEDGATINDGTYEYAFRDAVLGVFDLAIFQDDEFSWSFSSPSQTDVLLAIKVGETIDVRFREEFERVDHVLKYHFPPGVPNSGYGQFPIHITVDSLTPQGFRIVSSYEPQSKKTDSRLPFFFGFRVFGRRHTVPDFPIWRELLSQAVRHTVSRRWDHALLSAAFSLESFIDNRLRRMLAVSDVGDSYINHLLQVADRRFELHALNNEAGRLSQSAVNKLNEGLNRDVFSPRNNLAHGAILAADISQELVLKAIKKTVEFIWDWGPSAREWLLVVVNASGINRLNDDVLLYSCETEV